MERQDFERLVKESVASVYPKGKIKPAAVLGPDDVNIEGRFTDASSYRDFMEQGIDGLYIAVPDGQAERLLDRLLEVLDGLCLAYCSQRRSTDKDPKDSLRIVFLNTTDPLAPLRWEGAFGGDSSLTNEDLVDHFAALVTEFGLRFEDVSSNIVAGTIQRELSPAEARRLAAIMFEYNPETANFHAEEGVDEDELDLHDDAPYFVEKLAKHLHGNKTFYYWWD